MLKRVGSDSDLSSTLQSPQKAALTTTTTNPPITPGTTPKSEHKSNNTNQVPLSQSMYSNTNGGGVTLNKSIGNSNSTTLNTSMSSNLSTSPRSGSRIVERSGKKKKNVQFNLTNETKKQNRISNIHN